MKPLVVPLISLAGLGLCVSLWVHLGAVMGRKVAPPVFFGLLHVGAILIWFPAVLVAKQAVGNMNRKDLWNAVLKDLPAWMRYVVYGFFGYAAGNSLLFLGAESGGEGQGGETAAVWRGFSGHWMAFYVAALAILYAAWRREQAVKAYEQRD